MGKGQGAFFQQPAVAIWHGGMFQDKDVQPTRFDYLYRPSPSTVFLAVAGDDDGVIGQAAHLEPLGGRHEVIYPRREFMNIKTQMRTPWPGKLGTALTIVGLLLAVSVGCSPVSTQPSEQHTPSTTEPQAVPTTSLPTATSEALIPDGWVTHTSQRCEYTISHPAEMQVTNNGPHSRILGFELPDPDQGARNFIYVSVISPDLQVNPDEGVYNYDPAVAEILLSMQVGESKPVHEDPNTAPGFTYQRQPDAPISGHAAQTYENVQPWEFPGGTKEIRYLLSLNGCTYLIGGYMDTTGSNQPGAITEELFKQIVATIQLTP